MDSGTGRGPQIGELVEAEVSTKCNLSRKLSGSRPEDRLNDKIIDDNFRQRVEVMMNGIVALPNNWNDLTVREQRDWIYSEMKRFWINLPESLTFMCVGSLITGDCERSESDEKPEWLDHEKFLRGQRFAMDNFASIFLAQLLSLYTLFSFENGLKPMIITGKSSDPFASFRRYLSTGKRVKNWYSSDVWSKNTEAYNDVRAVRKMHSIVRQTLINSSTEDIEEASKITNSWSPTRSTLLGDFRDSCPVPTMGQCPYAFGDDEKFKIPKGMHQGEMAATQCGFVGLIILYPERFGIHGSTNDDLDAFCHVWRSLGYLLGIEDEFNFCTGSLEEVKQRSKDFFEHWVKPNLRDITPEWEHMLRCIVEGITYYFPSISYENALLYLAEILEIPMPRLRASLSFRSWLRYHLMKTTFYWTARLPGVKTVMNDRLIKSIDRALNFTDGQLELLREKSRRTLSKGIEETLEAHRELTTSTYWDRASSFIFSSTRFMIKLSITVKEFAKKLFRIDFGPSLGS